MKTRAIFSDERGFTMMEVVAASAIILVALTSMYIAMIYAEKSVQRTYHDRCATLIAAGELDWQYFYMKSQKHLDEFRPSTVEITRLPDGTALRGSISMALKPPGSNIVQGMSVPFQPVEITVAWREPGDRVNRNVVIRGDFFPQ